MHLGPYLVPAAVICALLCVYPLAQMARMAFSDVGPANLIGDWTFTGTENLREVLGTQRLLGRG